jgi:hypothetical protein
VAGDPTATTAAWNSMMNLANAGLVNNSQYEAIQQFMDIDNFIDFFILHLWAANTDWPHHNWYAVRNKNAGPRNCRLQMAIRRLGRRACSQSRQRHWQI